MAKAFKPNQVTSYTVVIRNLSQTASAELTVKAVNYGAEVEVRPIIKKGGTK